MRINLPSQPQLNARHRAHQPQSAETFSSASSLPQQVTVVTSSPACFERAPTCSCNHASAASTASNLSPVRFVRPSRSTEQPIASTSAAAIRRELNDRRESIAVSIPDVTADGYQHAEDTEPETRPDMAQFEIEETRAPLHPTVQTSLAVLGNFLRVGLSTGAGRLASWTVLQLLPSDLDLAAYAIASTGSVFRHYGAIKLYHGAAQTITSAPLRRTAMLGTALSAATMLAPVALLLLYPENKRLANTIAMQNIADFTYTAIRDPLQHALANVGPRITLPQPESWNQPDWRALPIVGGAYAVSTLGWLSLFDHAGAAGCGESPSCSALDTIGSAVAIESSEAIAMALIYSCFRDAVFRRDFSPRLPQPAATLINMSMRVFATGLMRLLEIWRREPDGLSNVEHAILLALMMFSLEMTAGLAQRTIARLSAADWEDVDENDDGTSIATNSTGADGFNRPQEQS